MKNSTALAVLAGLNCVDPDEREQNIEAFISLIEHFDVAVIHDHERFLGLADTMRPPIVAPAIG